MKKILFTAALAALMLSSCGGGGGTDMGSDYYISEAEKRVPAVQHEIFGEVPTLAIRYYEALSMLDSVSKVERDNISATANNDNYEEVAKKLEELKAGEEAVESELSQHYKAKINEAAKTVIGKEIPVKAEPSVYSAAKMVVAGVKADDHGGVDILANASLTAARKLKTLGGHYTTLSWKWLDASGNKLGTGGVQYFDKAFNAGDEVKLDTIRLAARDKAPQISSTVFSDK